MPSARSAQKPYRCGVGLRLIPARAPQCLSLQVPACPGSLQAPPSWCLPATGLGMLQLWRAVWKGMQTCLVLRSQPPDCVVESRGGGSVTDVAPALGRVLRTQDVSSFAGSSVSKLRTGCRGELCGLRKCGIYTASLHQKAQL